MSASIIQPNALNPAHRQLLPKTAGSRRQPVNPAATSATSETVISVQERAKINARNRVYDLFTSFVAISFIFCICTAMVATGGWVVYELFADVSSWSSTDLLDVIKRSNL